MTVAPGVQVLPSFVTEHFRSYILLCVSRKKKSSFVFGKDLTLKESKISSARAQAVNQLNMGAVQLKNEHNHI